MVPGLLSCESLQWLPMFGMSLRRRMDVRALRGMSVFANRGLCLHELLDKLMEVFRPVGNSSSSTGCWNKLCSWAGFVLCFMFFRISEMMKLVLSVQKQFLCWGLFRGPRLFYRLDLKKIYICVSIYILFLAFRLGRCLVIAAGTDKLFNKSLIDKTISNSSTVQLFFQICRSWIFSPMKSKTALALLIISANTIHNYNIGKVFFMGCFSTCYLFHECKLQHTRS